MLLKKLLPSCMALSLLAGPGFVAGSNSSCTISGYYDPNPLEDIVNYFRGSYPTLFRPTGLVSHLSHVEKILKAFSSRGKNPFLQFMGRLESFHLSSWTETKIDGLDEKGFQVFTYDASHMMLKFLDLLPEMWRDLNHQQRTFLCTNWVLVTDQEMFKQTLDFLMFMDRNLHHAQKFGNWYYAVFNLNGPFQRDTDYRPLLIDQEIELSRIFGDKGKELAKRTRKCTLKDNVLVLPLPRTDKTLVEARVLRNFLMGKILDDIFIPYFRLIRGYCCRTGDGIPSLNFFPPYFYSQGVSGLEASFRIMVDAVELGHLSRVFWPVYHEMPGMRNGIWHLFVLEWQRGLDGYESLEVKKITSIRVTAGKAYDKSISAIHGRMFDLLREFLGQGLEFEMLEPHPRWQSENENSAMLRLMMMVRLMAIDQPLNEDAFPHMNDEDWRNLFNLEMVAGMVLKTQLIKEHWNVAIEK